MELQTELTKLETFHEFNTFFKLIQKKIKLKTDRLDNFQISNRNTINSNVLLANITVYWIEPVKKNKVPNYN